jgi:hypothetical protein
VSFLIFRARGSESVISSSIHECARSATYRVSWCRPSRVRSGMNEMQPAHVLLVSVCKERCKSLLVVLTEGYMLRSIRMMRATGSENASNDSESTVSNMGCMVVSNRPYHFDLTLGAFSPTATQSLKLVHKHNGYCALSYRVTGNFLVSR